MTLLCSAALQMTGCASVSPDGWQLAWHRSYRDISSALDAIPKTAENANAICVHSIAAGILACKEHEEDSGAQAGSPAGRKLFNAALMLNKALRFEQILSTSKQHVKGVSLLLMCSALNRFVQAAMNGATQFYERPSDEQCRQTAQANAELAFKVSAKLSQVWKEVDTAGPWESAGLASEVAAAMEPVDVLVQNAHVSLDYVSPKK